MKNESLYHKTISILVKAYLNDTLIHGNCQACAVGNLVAGAKGYTYNKDECGDIKWSHCSSDNKEIYWFQVLGTYSGVPTIKMENYHSFAKDQIDSTGYSVENLAMIEKVFEKEGHPFIDNDPLCMYNGLMAVVEALGEIHEVSKETTEETKLMFVRP